MRTAHFGRWVATALTIACLLTLAATHAAAQDAGSLPAQVVTSGTAEVTIAATTASFTIAIDSGAPSAAAASADSTRVSNAVANALRAVGLSHEEIAQSQLTVGVRWDYDEATRKQRPLGYEATTTIELQTDRLDRLGTYMEAALGAGATTISAVSFAAKDTNEARRRALAQAVAQARSDAEVIARAGGGTLGQLLLLTTEPLNARGVELEEVTVSGARGMGPAERPNIIPSQIKVSATVVGHWKFIPGGPTR